MGGQGSRPRRATAWDVAGSGACGLGRRGEERARLLGGARGLPADDERGDHEQRADEEEGRECAGAAGVRRGDVEAGPGSALGPFVVNPNTGLAGSPTAAALGSTLDLPEAALRAELVSRFGDGVQLERHATLVFLALRAREYFVAARTITAAIIEKAVALVDGPAEVLERRGQKAAYVNPPLAARLRHA